MNAYYRYIGFTLFGLILGFIIWGEFFNLSLTRISSTSVTFGAHPNQMRNGRVVLMIVLGLTPLLFFISQKVSGNKSFIASIATIAVIFICGLVFWQLRIQFLLFQLESITTLNEGTGLDISYGLDQFYFEYYLAAGFLTGTLLSGFIFKKRKNKTTYGIHGKRP
jgi:predicted membrane channel-forming protein YqfA (hemolysin III family)